MKNNYTVEINGVKTELKDFTKSSILPEIIHSIKLDFDTDNPEGVQLIAFFVFLEVLLEKIKNKSEYSLLVESLINAILVIKKLEMDAGLGDNRF
jgi:hypothetical protein